MGIKVYTGDDFLAGSADDLNVKDGADDAFERADLGADAQGQQHQKEENGPERGRR